MFGYVRLCQLMSRQVVKLYQVTLGFVRLRWVLSTYVGFGIHNYVKVCQGMLVYVSLSVYV